MNRIVTNLVTNFVVFLFIGIGIGVFLDELVRSAWITPHVETSAQTKLRPALSLERLPDCPITSEETHCNLEWLWAVEAANEKRLEALESGGVIYRKIVPLQRNPLPTYPPDGDGENSGSWDNLGDDEVYQACDPNVVQNGERCHYSFGPSPTHPDTK